MEREAMAMAADWPGAIILQLEFTRMVLANKKSRVSFGLAALTHST